MAVSEMGCQNDGNEERKSFHEVGVRLIHSVCDPAQWGHGLLPATGCPAIAELKADEMGIRDQMQESQNHRGC